MSYFLFLSPAFLHWPDFQCKTDRSGYEGRPYLLSNAPSSFPMSLSVHLKRVWSWKVSGYLLCDNAWALASPQHLFVLDTVHTLDSPLCPGSRGGKVGSHIMHQPSTPSPISHLLLTVTLGGGRCYHHFHLTDEKTWDSEGQSSWPRKLLPRARTWPQAPLPLSPHIPGPLNQVIFFTLLLQVLPQHQTEMGKDNWQTIRLADSPVLTRGPPLPAPDMSHGSPRPHVSLHTSPPTYEEEPSCCPHSGSSSLAQC